MGRSSKEKNEWGLTPKEEAFALEYFATHNATQSYLKVFGCTYDRAKYQGWRLKEKATVKAYLAFLHSNLRNDKILSAEETLIKLSEIAKGKTEDGQKVIPRDQVKALEILAKHHAILTDVSKREIKKHVVIVDDLEEEEAEEKKTSAKPDEKPNAKIYVVNDEEEGE